MKVVLLVKGWNKSPYKHLEIPTDEPPKFVRQMTYTRSNKDVIRYFEIIPNVFHQEMPVYFQIEFNPRPEVWTI